MDRITNTDLHRICETINDDLRGVWVEVNARNGYTGLDRYDAGGMVDTLHVGTKREVYTYLQGMRRALMIRGR